MKKLAIFMWSVSGLCSSVPSPVPCYFDYCNFVVNLTIRQCDFSNFILLYHVYFAILVPFIFHIIFGISLFIKIILAFESELS